MRVWVWVWIGAGIGLGRYAPVDLIQVAFLGQKSANPCACTRTCLLREAPRLSGLVCTPLPGGHCISQAINNAYNNALFPTLSLESRRHFGQQATNAPLYAQGVSLFVLQALLAPVYIPIYLVRNGTAVLPRSCAGSAIALRHALLSARDGAISA